MKHICCADCRFVRADKTMSSRKWTAYECGNPKSEYHKALLNVGLNGEKLEYISWKGCEDGESRLSGAGRAGV